MEKSIHHNWVRCYDLLDTILHRLKSRKLWTKSIPVVRNLEICIFNPEQIKLCKGYKERKQFLIHFVYGKLKLESQVNCWLLNFRSSTISDHFYKWNYVRQSLEIACCSFDEKLTAVLMPSEYVSLICCRSFACTFHNKQALQINAAIFRSLASNLRGKQRKKIFDCIILGSKAF